YLIDELYPLILKSFPVNAQLSVNICQQFGSVSCLSHEKDLIDAETLAQVKVLNYDQFADLVLQFNRCISLK
ncbi:hypothetical protein ACFMKF_24355, partial [Acinetobacter baumannii]